MGTYKQRRSRKALNLKDAELRLTDCIKQIERVILDDDIDRDKMQLKIQATYAMSNAIGRLSNLIEQNEIIERIEALEEHQNLRKVG
ncbi:MAG: hypothetical protein FH748_08740 [Balneolaceae bacterium]|nr:hypothetical protein [Balneolaceae bacterium]